MKPILVLGAIGILTACSSGGPSLQATSGGTGSSTSGGTTTSGSTTGGTGTGSITAGSTAAGSTSAGNPTAGGSTGSSGSTGTTTGAGSTGGKCAGNGGACTSLANGAQLTNVVEVASASPDPSGGGAPPDGIYYLTSVLAYTGDGGASGETSETFQATLQLSGSGTEFSQVGTHDDCLFTATGTFSFGGTGVGSDTTCPAGEGVSLGYTSTSTSLMLFSLAQGPDSTVVHEVQVLTLQLP
jgi:hypothetical protein